MYLHLGGNSVIPAREVVSIVDGRLLTSETNRHLVETALAAGKIRPEELQGCKALVVTTTGIFASTVSPQSLARRLGAFSHQGLVGPSYRRIDSAQKRMIY